MEQIDEQVSVNLLNSTPKVLSWRGRQYPLQVGLHHTTREGRTLCHIFSVTDGNTFFKLQFNTETLSWRLLNVQPG